MTTVTKWCSEIRDLVQEGQLQKARERFDKERSQFGRDQADRKLINVVRGLLENAERGQRISRSPISHQTTLKFLKDEPSEIKRRLSSPTSSALTNFFQKTLTETSSS